MSVSPATVKMDRQGKPALVDREACPHQGLLSWGRVADRQWYKHRRGSLCSVKSSGFIGDAWLELMSLSMARGSGRIRPTFHFDAVTGRDSRQMASKVSLWDKVSFFVFEVF